MNFKIISQFKNKQFWWLDVLFYLFVGLLIAVILSYALFAYKSYLQEQKIKDLDHQINAYGTPEQKKYEQEVFAYKKKTDDFAALINNHKVISTTLDFLEKNTLPQIVFSGFNVTQSGHTITMGGEAETMDFLSQQIRVLEQENDVIESVVISGISAGEDGKVSFGLSIALKPKIFNYAVASSAFAEPKTNDTLDAALQPYVNVAEGFSLGYPKAWTKKEASEPDAFPLFVNPEQDRQGQGRFSANIGMVAQSTTLDLAAYGAAQKTARPAKFENYKSISETTVQVGGKDALLNSGTYTYSIFTLQNLQLTFIENGKAYIVTATALLSTWDTYKDLLTQSLMSVSFQ